MGKESIRDGVDRDLIPLDEQEVIERYPTVNNVIGRKEKKMQETMSKLFKTNKVEIPFSSDKIDYKYIHNTPADTG